MQEQEIIVDSEIEVATECESIEEAEEVVVDDEELAQAVEEDDDTIPKVTKRLCSEANIQFPAADYYNGAVYDTYCWSQTITDLGT